MPNYKITCRCTRCGNTWKRITKNPDSADPPCPNLACGQTPVPIGMDLSWNKAPAAIGSNIKVKAIDETAAIVMQDYGMTDLRDDVRPTETMTPKLPPILQERADNFFGGGGNRRRTPGFNPSMHAAAALQGAFTDPASTSLSIGATHAKQARPPVHLVADDRTAR